MENKNGITRESLLATDATATPIFCAVNAMILKSMTNISPIPMAHKNHGCFTESTKEIDLFINDPVITQVK